MHHSKRLGLFYLFLASTIPLALAASAMGATETGNTLVCIGRDDRLILWEASPDELAAHEASTGKPAARAHPATGTCSDPAGLGVTLGWTLGIEWLCVPNSEGRWNGPAFIWSTYRYEQDNYKPPDPQSGLCPEPRGFTQVRDGTEHAASIAVHLTELEVKGDLRRLYAWMHPDSQAIVPFSAMAGWYWDVFVLDPPVRMTIDEVRLVEWTWGVTGKVYPSTAEVTYRQWFADGREETGKVRLVRDDGVWRWFFGRDRDFVDQQIERYGSD